MENNKQFIEWWYKNGDKGKEHFSVFYINNMNEQSLFFVDFIIRFKNGVIGLFDAKTKRSDSEAPNKHNALIKYIEDEMRTDPNLKIIGGITIPETAGNNVGFRYCPNRISDTSDLTGWEYFNPAAINNSKP